MDRLTGVIREMALVSLTCCFCKNNKISRSSNSFSLQTRQSKAMDYVVKFSERIVNLYKSRADLMMGGVFC